MKQRRQCRNVKRRLFLLEFIHAVRIFVQWILTVQTTRRHTCGICAYHDTIALQCNAMMQMKHATIDIIYLHEL